MKHSVNKDYFKHIDEPNKAYWLGFIQADGCIYKQDSTLRFQMNLSSKDAGHLEKLREAIEATYPVKEKIVRLKGKEYSSSQIRIDSKEFCINLMENGIDIKKSLNSNFPDLPSELMPHYIRGFFDGDGGMKFDKRGSNTRTRINFTGGKDFLEKLKDYFDSIGVIASKKAIEKNSRSEAHMLSYSSKDNNIKIYQHLYNSAEIYLDRKFEKINEMLDRYSVPPHSDMRAITKRIAGNP